MIEKIHIYDMDGTVVSSLHRYRTKMVNNRVTIDLDYWLENEHRAMDDSLLPHAAQYQADLKDPSVYVVIATARVLRFGDLWFINNVLGMPDHIISRNGRGDSRGGADMKIKGLRKLLNLKQFQGKELHFWEDNLSYLSKVCEATGAIPHHVPSAQGH